MAAPFEPTVIRCSALSGYPDCPRRGAARLFWREIQAAGYVLRRTVRGIGAAIGTATHESAAATLGEKARSGKLPPLSVAQDAAVASLQHELAGGVMYDADRGPTHNARQAEAQTLAMSSAYHRIVAPEIQPIIIEQRLEAEVEPGLVLSGQPDVIAREPARVRDLKSGTRSPGSNAPQLGGYSLLARSNGLDIEEAAIDFVQRVAIGRPQPDPVSKAVPIGPAEAAASNILRHIADDLTTFRQGDELRRIRPGDPWAFIANPSSILCSQKYCPAHGTHFCREWQPK